MPRFWAQIQDRQGQIEPEHMKLVTKLGLSIPKLRKFIWKTFCVGNTCESGDIYQSL